MPKLDLDRSTWQRLMDSAYDKWREQRDPETGKNEWSYAQFLHNLTVREREAVLLGNMNYQIENGGVSQWVDNGYAAESDTLLLVLKQMKSPRAKEWAEQLAPFVRAYVDTTEKKGFFGNHWLHDQTDEDENDDVENAADKLTDAYYAEPFKSEFLLEVEAYLTAV